MKITLLSLALCTILFSACKKKNEAPASGINIRIENKSSYQFDNVLVWAGDVKNNYGSIKPGQTSEYKIFNEAYRYAYVKLNVGEKEFILQPIDYVGETPLEAGKYTYQLTVSNYDQSRLNLSYKKD
ncbi:hypothetical protein GS399_09000 [Pedobacter sp. HMF7647]|uniref:Uncharacterized protein n=1 Tax=Hufsiella arboris TaxID=2695275 RepID=A0A7K1Y934_9SPHI|nr:hypothetical protein [Hufsiella arboris]MXV51104.1 hypothetical protein [Hufsiella arboris]